MNLEIIKNILIIRRNGFGDLICTIPLIHYLHEKCPEAKITLIASDRNSSLVPFVPFIHRVEFFSERGNKYINALKLAFKLRKEKFDIALSAKSSPMKLMNFFLKLINADYKIAYVDKKCGHSKWINRPVLFSSKEGKEKHQALKTLQLIDPDLKEVPEYLYPSLVPPQNPLLDIRWSLHPLMNKPGKCVVLSVSNTLSTNAFSEEKYSRIINELSQRHALKILVLGLDKDRERGEKLASLIKTPVFFHIPENFEEFLYILNLAECVFVSDGGTAHLSAALGKSGVIYFGATSATEWSPLSKKMEIVSDIFHAENIPDDHLICSLEKVLAGEILWK